MPPYIAFYIYHAANDSRACWYTWRALMTLPVEWKRE